MIASKIVPTRNLTAVSIRIPSMGMVILDHRTDGFFINTVKYGDYNSWIELRGETGSSGPVFPSPVFPIFQEWVGNALKIHIENKEVLRAWITLLRDATSWLQLFKAFPEVIEILIGAAPAFIRANENSWNTKSIRNFVIPKLRKTWASVQGTCHLESRAAIMNYATTEIVSEARPLARVICAQAALLPAENSKAIDDTPFRNTWVKL